jgi:glycosyltransferase involved in cell wall biosynthesis
MKKQTILILNWRLPTDPKAGGAERVTLQHANAWVKAGFQVIWLSGSPRGLFSRERRAGIEYIAMGPSQLFFLFAGLYRLIFIHVRVDCIVDEVHGFPAWSVLWAPKTAKIAFIHEVALEIWDVMYPFPISSIGKMIERTLFPFFYKSTPFWVDATSVASDLVKIGIPESSIHVIPCAVDVPRSIVWSKQKESAFTLIVLSRIVAMKGISYAVDTYIQVKKNIPDTQLWIVGDGDKKYIEELECKLSENGMLEDVTFWGRVSEAKKFDLLSRAHFLLHTSVREGFGLTILEAEHAGTPSATFDVTGLKDLVHNGENGIQVEFPNTSYLAKALIRLKSDLETYTTLRMKARSHAGKFTWSRFVKQRSSQRSRYESKEILSFSKTSTGQRGRKSCDYSYEIWMDYVRTKNRGI